MTKKTDHPITGSALGVILLFLGRFVVDMLLSGGSVCAKDEDKAEGEYNNQ